MTMGIGFHNPNYDSKYGSEGIKKQLNSKNEPDMVEIKKKKKKSKSASEGNTLLAVFGTIAAGILAFKNRAKIKEFLPKIKETGKNAFNAMREKFPQIKESVKNAGTAASEKVKNIFSKKA